MAARFPVRLKCLQSVFRDPECHPKKVIFSPGCPKEILKIFKQRST